MVYKQLTLELTQACDIRCAHCDQDHIRKHMDTALAKRAIAGLEALGEINRLSFTGGEPFLRYKEMLELAAYGAELGLPFGVVTNARWAKSPEVARERLGRLHTLGLDVLAISYDVFHQAFVPEDHVRWLLAEAKALGMQTQLYVSRHDATPIRQMVEEICARFDLPWHEVAVRDVVPLGHGAQLPVHAAVSYFDVGKECPTLNGYNVWHDGEVLPCCSAGTHIGLSHGNLQHDSVADVVARRQASQLIAMIHRHGLDEIVIRLPEAVRNRIAAGYYVSSCHLCHELVSDPEARAAAEALDADAIGLIEKLLISPKLTAQLPRPSKRAWRGPPVVTA